MNFISIIKNKNISIEQISVLNSIWFWISLAELMIIIFLIYKLKSSNKVFALTDEETKHLNNSKNTKIDMDNLMDSIHNSRNLYKELCAKCHPDRFINDPKQNIAEEIFQEISKNERNHKELNLLKIRAINELNLTFK
jgi:hypothetical protein